MSDAAGQPSPSRHGAGFAIVAVALNAMGIGVTVPVMPDLLRDLGGMDVSDAAVWGGYLAFLYAGMQFLFSPMLGNLSDRFGRRPVLLVSQAMMALDYLIMALAPSLWLLFVGRLLSGISGATMTVASAFIADVSPPERRAANFGLVGAGFGIGFVIGPVIGGLAGEIGPRVPFFAAAGLALLNFVYGWLILPESLPPARRRAFSWARSNPMGALRQIAALPMVAWFFAAFGIFILGHNVYPAIWSFWAQAALGWSSAEIGVSLAVVGVAFAVVQAGLIRVAVPRFGEVRTAAAGLILGAAGLIGLAFAESDWMVYVIIPITALGAIHTPAITGLMANLTPDDAQGELQGAISSLQGVASLASPLLMTQIFGAFTGPGAVAEFPGAPYLAAAILMLAALVPFAVGLRRGGIAVGAQSAP